MNQQADAADQKDEQDFVVFAEAYAALEDEADTQNIVDVGGDQEAARADSQIGKAKYLGAQKKE